MTTNQIEEIKKLITDSHKETLNDIQNLRNEVQSYLKDLDNVKGGEQ